MNIETAALHAGYQPKNGEPRVMPIVQSTTYTFDSTEAIADVFDEPTHALIYSRFANPTVMAVEAKMAALEGGVAAMATSSGQAASLISILNVCNAGDSIVTSAEIYGGTVNLFAVTLAKYGIEAIFLPPNPTDEQIHAAFKPNTKALFGETIANPALSVLDIERYARIAHEHGVPLMVDNTFATPALCRPIEYGADVVIHSTSKYLDGHALQVGGMIVDAGKFDYANGNFPDFTEPDESYHGITYVGNYSAAPFVIKARMQLMRDFGAYPSAHSAFLLNLGIETLPLRMERYSSNAQAVAEHFAASNKIQSVRYPGLPGDPSHELAQRYLTQSDGVLRASGVLGIEIAAGREAAIRFMDALKLASREVHVADIRTCVLHPASATHRQLTDEQLVAAGIDPGYVRFSVGLENINDILADIDQALLAI